MLDGLHINWDAALTLGTATVAAFFLALGPIKAFHKWNTRDSWGLAPSLFQMITASVLLGVFVAGCTLGLMFLGTLAAYGMVLMGIPQGVLTIVQLQP